MRSLTAYFVLFAFLVQIHHYSDKETGIAKGESSCSLSVVPTQNWGEDAQPFGLAAHPHSFGSASQSRLEVPCQDPRRDGYNKATVEVPYLLQDRETFHAQMCMVWQDLAGGHGLHLPAWLCSEPATAWGIGGLGPSGSGKCPGTKAHAPQKVQERKARWWLTSSRWSTARSTRCSFSVLPPWQLGTKPRQWAVYVSSAASAPCGAAAELCSATSAPLPQGPVSAPDQFWLQQMNQMPVLNAVPAAAQNATPTAAELHLQNILGALRHSEETWTPEVQQAVQQVDQTNLQLNLGQVHASVHEIGRAKTEVAEAEAARLRLITSWRTFLQYSVSRWKEYASLFQSQETAIQNQIAAAKAQLIQAQRQFGRTSEVVRDGSIPISDDEEGVDNAESKQVKDEEMKSEATHKITAGLSQVVNSLQQLSEQAEAEERKAKRLRSSGDIQPGEAPAPSSAPAQLPSMQPFGTPGVK